MTDFVMETAAEGRLEDCVGSMSVVLNINRRSASLAMYAIGS
ncbi:MAG TPA: hypothetical protein VKB80_21380 [Kofleriaceae bacterium]|nr:hypothetical protein [Kofleriaceae bacterium]